MRERKKRRQREKDVEKGDTDRVKRDIYRKGERERGGRESERDRRVRRSE